MNFSNVLYEITNKPENLKYQDVLIKLQVDYIDLLYGDMEGLYYLCDEGIAWIPYYLPMPYYNARLDIDKACVINKSHFGNNTMEQLMFPIQELNKVQNKYLEMLNKIK